MEDPNPDAEVAHIHHLPCHHDHQKTIQLAGWVLSVSAYLSISIPFSPFEAGWLSVPSRHIHHSCNHQGVALQFRGSLLQPQVIQGMGPSECAHVPNKCYMSRKLRYKQRVHTLWLETRCLRVCTLSYGLLHRNLVDDRSSSHHSSRTSAAHNRCIPIGPSEGVVCHYCSKRMQTAYDQIHQVQSTRNSYD